MDNNSPPARHRTFATRLARCIVAVLLATAPLAARASDIPVLRGLVDQAMVEQAIAAIHEHSAVVDLASEWRGSDGYLMSGGNSQLGWLLGEMFHIAKMKVRCTGLCFSSAAHILIASRGCVVGPHGRIALHVPVPIAGALSQASTDNIALRDGIAADWRARTMSYGVPSDIVDRALLAHDRRYELRTYDMQRIGCTIE
jgi:hypothetical protein